MAALQGMEAGKERWHVGLEEMGEKTEEIRKKERGSVLIMCYCYLCRDIMEERERGVLLPPAPLHLIFLVAVTPSPAPKNSICRGG